MKKKRLYFVRHGQTENNRKLIRPDASAPLNDQGREQAEVIARRLQGINPDLIVTSSMERSQQTAEIMKDILGVPVVASDLFIERILPSESVGKHANDPELLAIDAQIIANQSDPNWRYSDEENFFDVRDRCYEAIKLLDEREEETIVVVTHSMFLRYIIGTMLDPDINPVFFRRWFLFTKINNTGITLCSQNPEDNLHTGWRMEAWNDDTHLEHKKIET